MSFGVICNRLPKSYQLKAHAQALLCEQRKSRKKSNIAIRLSQIMIKNMFKVKMIVFYAIEMCPNYMIETLLTKDFSKEM